MNGKPRLYGSRLEFVPNLARHALTLTSHQIIEGDRWWRNAGAAVADLGRAFGVRQERVVYAAAALSPGIPWTGVLETLELLLVANRDWQDMPRGSGHLTFGYRGRERAWAILREGKTELCKGVKVEAVAANLFGDYDEVAVDRHVVRAATGADIVQVSTAQSKAIAKAVQVVAYVRGWQPAGFQAAIWLAGRDKLSQKEIE